MRADLGLAVADCEHCLSKRSVHRSTSIIPPPSQPSHHIFSPSLPTKRHLVVTSDSAITFRNVTGLGGRQWVQFHYRVTNREAGEAHVFVNDEPAVNISSLNHRAGYHDVVPIELNLREGAVNTITFGMSGKEAGIVLDGIEVVED